MEKRELGLTNETYHPWTNEWLSPEDTAKEEVRVCPAACAHTLPHIARCAHRAPPLDCAGGRQEASGTHPEGRGHALGSQGRDPSQSKKSIEAQESAIAALKNLEWYDLADPGLLSQLAVLNKRFPWPPELRGAPELPDESRDTIPWLPVEVRDAIRWMFCNPRLNRMELQTWVEIVFAKLEGDACDYVLSCLEEDPIVQKDLLDAIQSLESNDDLNQSVLATLRLRIVRNLHPFRHGEILVGLVESAGDDVATAAAERFALTRRYGDRMSEEAIPLVTEQLVKALHSPLALKVLLAGLHSRSHCKMEEALLPLVGTLIQQLQGGDAATHTRQLVEALPPRGRVRMQCVPAFVEMLPDQFALKMLLAACKCTTAAECGGQRVPDWELRHAERAKASLTKALPPCMGTLVRKAQDDDAKAAAKQVLGAVQAMSPELLAPYAKDIIDDDSLFELAPMLPKEVRAEYAIQLVRAAVNDVDEGIRSIAKRALVVRPKVVAKLFKYLTSEDTAVQDRARRLLYSRVADSGLARHAEQIFSAPDGPAFVLVEKLPVDVLEERLIDLVTYHATHESEAVRGIAAKALGKLADKTIAASTATVERLAGYLESDDEAVQARAVSLLGRVGGAALAPHVGLILRDPNRAAFQLLEKLERAELQAHDGVAGALMSLLEKGMPSADRALNKLSSDSLGHLSDRIMELWLRQVDAKLQEGSEARDLARKLCGSTRDLALKLPPNSIDERFTPELERVRGSLFLSDAADNPDQAPGGSVGGSVGGSAAPDATVSTTVSMEVSPPQGADDAEPPAASASEVTVPQDSHTPSFNQPCFPLSHTRRPCVCTGEDHGAHRGGPRGGDAHPGHAPLGERCNPWQPLDRVARGGHCLRQPQESGREAQERLAAAVFPPR